MDSTGKRHIETSQRGPNLKAGSWDNNRHKQSELNRKPKELAQELFSAIVQGLVEQIQFIVYDKLCIFTALYPRGSTRYL
jgi:hypothetical protein